MTLPRRHLLLAAGATVWLRPARATPLEMELAIAAFTGGAPLREGRLTLEIAPLVENGNAVPVGLGVADGVAPGAVRALALFTSGNPQPGVIVARFGPRSGRARLDTRMRLASSQTVVALAQFADGSCWRRSAEVVVTLAACVES